MTAESMAASTANLWTQADGTVCCLSELDEDPRFELRLLRSGNILRCRRLYSSAAAEMVAASWQEAIKDIR